jgi:CRP-like cAMP-binding protein
MPVEIVRLRRFPLFQALSEELLETIAAFSSRVHFDRGDSLFLFGDAAEAFYLVEYGRVKVYRANPSGREQILHVVEDGQSVAEVAVLSLDIYPASATALAETAAVRVPRQPFLDLIASNGQAARAMLAGQAKWLRHMVDLTAALLLDDIEARLARYLVLYADNRGIPWRNGTQLDLDIKKAVIAAQIGTLPETLSRNFAKLEGKKLIRRDGRTLVILDSSALHALAFPELEG